MQIKRFGWKPDLPDIRDHQFSCGFARLAPEELPKSVDLRAHCPAVYDQGDLGSCTANAIGGAFEFCQLKEKINVFTPSRLFIYYQERVMEGTVDSDAGAMIRDGIKAVNCYGVCPESVWPYNIDHFTCKPTSAAYQNATGHKAMAYQRLNQTITEMKQCLASGYPFTFGFTVYESFESETVAQTGLMPMPSPSDTVLGGHAVLAVGYDDDQKHVIVRNSWGPNWGVQGYFYMPYDYITNPDLADDFWTIRIVE